MSKFKSFLFLIGASSMIVSCLSGNPTRSIERQNQACNKVGALPEILDANEIIYHDAEPYNPTWYTNQWNDYALRQSDCIRAAQCAEAWLQYDGNCGWEAAQRGRTLKGFIGLSESCSFPKPGCKP